MPSRFYFQLAVIIAAVILCLAVIHAWRADRRDRSQLAADLAATRQLLAAADARQHDRDAQLTQTLAAIAAEKRTIVTPAQILRELPQTLPLPVPIKLQSGQAPTLRATLGSPATNAGNPPTNGTGISQQRGPAPASSGKPAPDGAFLPRADLKPLYDFTLDCKACQARLAVAQGNLADEQKKTAALTLERDAALRIARGGSAWRRIARAAKWFAIGAAVGAVAAKATR